MDGATRNETIINICKYIDRLSEDKENIIVTHDAVRPFITKRIIDDNINEIMDTEVDAVDTAIPAYDTIVEAKKGDIISNIPIRNHMYQGQTPQTFRVNELMDTYRKLTCDEKNILTDAAKIYILKDKKVKIVKGEPYNFKITTQYDLELAEALLKTQENNKYK